MIKITSEFISHKQSPNSHEEPDQVGITGPEMQWWNRVNELLKRRGWTQRELARRTGISYDLVRKYTTGAVVNPRGDVFNKLSSALGVSPSWLEYGNTLPSMTISVIGAVGAGETFHPDPDGVPAEQIHINADDLDLFAVTVRGNSGLPTYRPGEVVACSRMAGFSENGFLNQDCVVHLRDGRAFLKKVVRGSKPGLYTLISYQGDPIENVAIDWAAPVVFVIRRPALLLRD